MGDILPSYFESFDELVHSCLFTIHPLHYSQIMKINHPWSPNPYLPWKYHEGQVCELCENMGFIKETRNPCSRCWTRFGPHVSLKKVCTLTEIVTRINKLPTPQNNIIQLSPGIAVIIRCPVICRKSNVNGVYESLVLDSIESTSKYGVSYSRNKNGKLGLQLKSWKNDRIGPENLLMVLFNSFDRNTNQNKILPFETGIEYDTVVELPPGLTVEVQNRVSYLLDGDEVIKGNCNTCSKCKGCGLLYGKIWEIDNSDKYGDGPHVCDQCLGWGSLRKDGNTITPGPLRSQYLTGLCDNQEPITK